MMAKKYEPPKGYLEEILKYYLSGLGNMNYNAPHKEYARKARVMAKVQHLMVEVLGDQDRWKKYAAKFKEDNIRRRAFQEEFARMLPDWGELN
jgi:hypothetical protein